MPNSRFMSHMTMCLVPVKTVVVHVFFEIGAAAGCCKVKRAALNTRVHGQIIPVSMGFATPTRRRDAVQVVSTAVQCDARKLQSHPYTKYQVSETPFCVSEELVLFRWLFSDAVSIE
jgi:hypothetical protein